MAVFVELWPCLFTTKLSYTQLFKWGHSTALDIPSLKYVLKYTEHSWSILYTYKDAFNRVSKILLGKSHCASSKYCSTRHPIVQSENPAINLNWVKIRHTTDLIPQVESPIVHHPGGGSGDGGATECSGGVFGKLARIINFSCYNQDCAIWQPTSE